MRYTQEQFKQRLEALIPEMKDFVLYIEASDLISNLTSKYKLDEDASFNLGHNISLYILRFITKDELAAHLQDILSINQKVAREECGEIERGILAEVGIQDEDEELLKNQPSENTSNDSLNHVDILSEIENPTPSIKASGLDRSAISQDTGEKINVSESEKGDVVEYAEPSAAVLGGFMPLTSTQHPATPIASKLDQKLVSTTSSSPKEIYHVKKPDPYHEPIE